LRIFSMISIKLRELEKLAATAVGYKGFLPRPTVGRVTIS